MDINVHRTINYTIDYPPLILAPGSLIEMWPIVWHEGPHEDDILYPPDLSIGTIIETDVNPNNYDFVWDYLVSSEDEDWGWTLERMKSVKRVLQFADWPDAY
jgi:hypothetical protein